MDSLLTDIADYIHAKKSPANWLMKRLGIV